VRVSPFFLAALAPLLLAHSASGQQAQEDSPLSRVSTTTGVVITSGWEKSIVRKDPNLANWNWNAMYSVTASRPNGSSHRIPKSDHKQSTTTAHYVKPIHLPLPNVAHAPFKHTNNAVSTDTSLSYHSNEARPTTALAYSYATSKSATVDPFVSSSQTALHGKVLTRHI
jgi:hypothetical protein